MSERRFNFGLERVRQVRVHAEDQAKEQLAASMADRLRGAQALQDVEDRLADALRPDAVGPTATALSGAALAARQAFTERLEHSRRQAQADLGQADAIVAARRGAVLEAGREREVLDRLRAKQSAAHQASALRAEGSRLDELALTMHVRAGKAAAS